MLEANKPAPPGNEFGGRLQFKWEPLTPQKEKIIAGRSFDKVSIPIVEHQYMCVKFLLKKVTNSNPPSAPLFTCMSLRSTSLVFMIFLFEQAQGNGVSDLELFNFFDADGDGVISLPEFSNAMQRFNIYGSTRETKAVMV